jgi:hypothetical protein
MAQYENIQQVASQMKAILDRIVQARNSPQEVQRAAEDGKRQLDQFSPQGQGQQGQGQPGLGQQGQQGQGQDQSVQELRRNMDELRQKVDRLIGGQGGYGGQQGQPSQQSYPGYGQVGGQIGGQVGGQVGGQQPWQQGGPQQGQPQPWQQGGR